MWNFTKIFFRILREKSDNFAKFKNVCFFERNAKNAKTFADPFPNFAENPAFNPLVNMFCFVFQLFYWTWSSSHIYSWFNHHIICCCRLIIICLKGMFAKIKGGGVRFNPKQIGIQSQLIYFCLLGL